MEANIDPLSAVVKKKAEVPKNGPWVSLTKIGTRGKTEGYKASATQGIPMEHVVSTPKTAVNKPAGWFIGNVSRQEEAKF